MRLAELGKQKIAIWGEGREGNVVARLLETEGREYSFISDADKDDLEQFSVVIKSPGVSVYKPEIIRAKKNGVYFTSATNLFLAEAMCREKRPTLIGITGTKGKSTTSALTAHILSGLGYKTFLGGNFGTPLLEALPTLDVYDFIVAEVSSYQAADLECGFDAALVNNLYPEHLNWHLSHEKYYQDKLNIFARTPKKIVNGADAKLAEMTKDMQVIAFNVTDATEGFYLENGDVYKGNVKYLSGTELPLPGAHNLANLCGALTLIQALGVKAEPEKIAVILSSFKPLPHRLQIVAKGDVCFVDDSISTTPETAMAALDVFAGRPITLIAGGFDRGQDYAELAKKIRQNNVKVVTLPDTGSRICAEVQKCGGEAYEAADMASAVRKAKEITPVGGVVLLSPAAPSYGVYKNFEERGKAFAELV